MKYLITSCFLLIAQFSLSQNIKTLSYPEIDSILSLYESSQEHEKGIKLCLDASQKSGQQDSLCGEYLEWAAYFYEFTTQQEKVIEYYTKALHVFEQSIGKYNDRYAVTLSYLGKFYQTIEDHEKALPIFFQLRDIDEKVSGVEHPNFSSSLNSIAVIYKELGNYEKALPLYIQSKNILEKALGVENPDFAASLNNLALVYKELGNYDKAIPLYIQSKNIAEKIFGAMHPNFAISLSNLALMYQDMRDYKKALSTLKQSKDIREKVFGTKHPQFARSLNQLANIYNELENYEKALPLYLQAKDIYEKNFGTEHPAFANSLTSLAYLYNHMEKYDKALPLFQQSKEIKEKIFGVQHPLFSNSLNNLASVHMEIGNYDEAWEKVLQAIRHLSSTNISSDFDVNWFNSLFKAPYKSNKHLEYMIDALEIVHELLTRDSTIINTEKKQATVADLAMGLLSKLQQEVSNEKDKLRILAQSNLWLHKSLEVLTKKEQRNKAFNLSDQNKSVLLLQATKSEKAYQLGELPDSLIQHDKKLLKKQSLLQAKLLENRPKEEKDSLRNLLNHVTQDIDAFVKTIEQNFPKYHKLKYQQINAKVEDIQALLDEHTVLLEYVISDTLLHIFKISKKEVAWVAHPLNKKSLLSNVKEFHNILKNYRLLIKKADQSYQKYSTLAYWFYQHCVAPVLKETQGVKNLIIVTDGVLGHLPFESFLVEQAPQQITDYNKLHYLVSDYNISYNYSATLWKENIQTPALHNNNQILGIAANYDSKLDSTLLNVRLPTDQRMRANLSPLPAARKEVETLQEKYQGFFAFDELANEKMVKEKAPDHAILHFATHGILETKKPVLSSLALTEDNDPIESNFWQAHEISKIQLNADLVVLSACETGYGRFEAGNGIASLARAFMYAGSPSLIVSLWQVNDFATSQIMQKLYDNLADGIKKDEALRQAKLQYMKSVTGVMAHPAFWSPFIMMGKTDAIRIHRKGEIAWGTWGIGLGVFSFLGVGLLLWRRKRNA